MGRCKTSAAVSHVARFCHNFSGITVLWKLGREKLEKDYFSFVDLDEVLMKFNFYLIRQIIKDKRLATITARGKGGRIWCVLFVLVSPKVKRT